MPKTKPNVFDGQNITASEFFKTHWQQAPYLFTNTNIDLSCLPDIEQMFELAAQEDVQSRIVFSEDDVHYQAIYDEPEAWDEVKDLKPTMLVSDIEKWFPQAIKIMNWFPFIKNWRFDDLMMSFAPKGASVGAHTDHYDVFLVQVQGTRQWSFDDQPLTDCNMVEDSELAVIADYEPQHTEILNPGDVLYLPPEIPHHGISTSDDCVTCSIGLRSPSDAEAIMVLAEAISAEKPADSRFKDAVSQTAENAAIGSHEIAYLRQLLLQINQFDDNKLALYFGQLVTGYRLLDEADDTSYGKKDTQRWCKSPFASFAYYQRSEGQTWLFVNGETFATKLESAQLICDNETFEITQDDVFTALIDQQYICPATEKNI